MSGSQPDDISRDTPAPRWTLAGRIAFRFLALYILLFLQWGPILSIPFPKLDAWNTSNWNALTLLVAHHVLHISVDVNTANTGSGDTSAQWVQAGFCLVFSLVAAGLWSIVDRKRLQYDRLYDWLRVYVRYMLFFELATYGLIKVIPSQFFAITPDKLAERIGDSSPMGLLWTFMAASTPYTVFAGAMELVSGLLLTLRRTTTLGALMSCAVMSNVFVLNMCYDVPVKLLSGQLLLLGIFLLAPDMRRLTDLLLLGKGAPPLPQRPLFASSKLEVAARVVGTLVVIGFLAVTVRSSVQQRKMVVQSLAPAPRTPLSAIWDVDSFQENATTPAWMTLTIYDTNFGAVDEITTANGKKMVFRCVIDTKAQTLAFRHRRNHPTSYSLAYALPNKQQLLLTGTHDGHPLTVKLHCDQTRYLLTHTGFHWINEIPNNQ